VWQCEQEEEEEEEEEEGRSRLFRRCMEETLHLPPLLPREFTDLYTGNQPAIYNHHLAKIAKLLQGR
jgi:hypothetical protein